MQPIAIDHVVIRTASLEAMLAFYVEVLGCGLERRLDDIGLVQLRAGAALIDLVPVDGKLGALGGAAPGVEARNMDHLCLRVAAFDPQAIRAELAAKGVQSSEPGVRYGSSGNALSVNLRDPDGNGVELRG